MDALPGEDAFAVLCEQERRRDIIASLVSIVSQLDHRQRRVLLMYIDGYSMNDIGIKLRTHRKDVQRIIDGISYEIHGNYEDLRKLIVPPQSMLTAGYAKYKLCWALDAAENASVINVDDDNISKSLNNRIPRRRTAKPEYTRSRNVASVGKWGLTNGYVVWKSVSQCRVPELFQGCFGDNDTKCTLCGIQCTRRKSQC